MHRENGRTIFVSPVIFFHHTVKHALACGVYAADIFYYPVALVTNEGQLGIYLVDRFPFRMPDQTDRKMSEGLVVGWFFCVILAGWVYFAEGYIEWAVSHDIYSYNALFLFYGRVSGLA